MNTLYQTFEKNLPTKPYCTDDLFYGLKIRNIEHAIKKRYIQPNKPTDLKWLVYDVDRSTGHFDWYDVNAPAPNFTVMNPENGHAHLFYGLEVPVYMQMGAKQNPIRYVSSIDIALTQRLEADENYAKLVSKNPLNNSWTTHIWRETAYDLAELADSFDLSKYKDRRVRLPDIGLGRNCNLFDSTRFWAYREIRKPVENYLFKQFDQEADFIARCITFAKINNLFDSPLPLRECETIGKSVGKWVYRNMSAEGFRKWGDQRRKKSISVRQAAAAAKAKSIQEYKENNPKASIRAIAEVFECSIGAVSQYLKL